MVKTWHINQRYLILYTIQNYLVKQSRLWSLTRLSNAINSVSNNCNTIVIMNSKWKKIRKSRALHFFFLLKYAVELFVLQRKFQGKQMEYRIFKIDFLINPIFITVQNIYSWWLHEEEYPSTIPKWLQITWNSC